MGDFGVHSILGRATGGGMRSRAATAIVGLVLGLGGSPALAQFLPPPLPPFHHPRPPLPAAGGGGGGGRRAALRSTTWISARAAAKNLAAIWARLSAGCRDQP